MSVKPHLSRAARFIAPLIVLFVSALPQGVAAQPAGIDPQAEKLLKGSMAYLGGLKQLSVEASNSIEAVLKSGQKIQFNGVATLSLQRPNKLRAERKADLVDQVFYYDGKSLTLYNPKDRFYATVAAPGSLDEAMDFARTSLDIVSPGQDLLYADAYAFLMKNVNSGFVVGKSVIEGVRCDHLAFRGAGTDFQIWIQEGKQPLPRKFVITTTDVAGFPQFSVVMSKWNVAPALADKTFAFVPPKGAKKVEFLPPPGSAPKAK
ncbi:MAG: DUF2092 domain-containing protein [Betaproteobacteria bacterium]|nr:DUF2092 domain-containing protein [Betaproteobacteria bacterium]